MAFTFKQLKQAKSNLMAAGLDPASAAGVLSSAAPETIEKIMAGDIPQAIKDQCTQGTARKDQGTNDPQHTARKDPQVPASATQVTKDQEPRKDQGTRKAGKAPTKDHRKRSAQARKRSSAPQAPAFDTPAGVPTALDCPQDCAHDCGKDQGTAQRSASAPDTASQTDDIIQDPIDDMHALPAGLYDDICATIDYYCQEHDINDCQKIHPIQWRAVCMSIGSGIKSRKLLYDMDYLKINGGKKYDDSKVLSLLFLYDRVCADYKQVAFMHNFPPFAGVSREYLNDYMQRDLTSTQCGLRQKAYDLQRASLVGAVTGGGSATVGNIFLSKALAGLQETVTVQHVSAAAAPQVAALPVFDDGGTLLPDNGGEK